MVMKFDPYGLLMINRGNRIFDCVPFMLLQYRRKLSTTMLIANVANLARFVTLTF